MPIEEHRGPLIRGIEEARHWEKSPLIQGLYAGAKGALVGAPLVGFIQALRGKSPMLGAITGAIGLGALTGVAKAVAQDVENVTEEAGMRYHMDRLRGREPAFFSPPPNIMERALEKALNKKRRPVRIVHIPKPSESKYVY